MQLHRIYEALRLELSLMLSVRYEVIRVNHDNTVRNSDGNDIETMSKRFAKCKKSTPFRYRFDIVSAGFSHWAGGCAAQEVIKFG